MCLENPKPYEGEKRGFGWKVFACENGKLSFQYYCGHKLHPTDWMEAAGSWWQNTNGYPPGFHIFMREEDAITWRGSTNEPQKVRKVEYEEAHTIGMQDGLETIVARKMRIVE